MLRVSSLGGKKILVLKLGPQCLCSPLHGQRRHRHELRRGISFGSTPRWGTTIIFNSTIGDLLELMKRAHVFRPWRQQRLIQSHLSSRSIKTSLSRLKLKSIPGPEPSADPNQYTAAKVSQSGIRIDCSRDVTQLGCGHFDLGLF